ncbi:MAG: DNA polymerase/3'-5' exonuclease PolX [Taibaiella sp.]|nr:DNA polymerase/3'-5' exonuclease PolX [Taibaiella sp.]
MTNDQVADKFSLLSKLMDIHGENSFKSKTYSINAYNIEKLPREITEMTTTELFGMKGIGGSTGKKIQQILATGRLDALDEILERTPPGILDMLAIKGLGPKKLAVVWKELGIESVGELEYACNENRLVALKGFGAKTQQGILDNIQEIKKNEGFYLWADAEKLATVIINNLEDKFPAALFSVTGAFRRQLETIAQLDFITNIPVADVSGHFASMEEAVVRAEGDDTININLPGFPVIMVHCTDTDSYYNRLFATTATEDFIAAFRVAYTMPANAASEKEIFAVNKLQFIEPAMRESAAVLTRSAAGTLPTLIQKADIKGIIHSHSKWSDGLNTIEQMALAAKEQGYEYLVMSDHSQAAYYANGLKPEQIAAQHIEIDALNVKLAPFKIFKSIEADILNDGALDYGPEILSTFDLVIASVHSNLKMSQEKAMARVMAAIANPFTTILGHPTGRLLLSRKGYPLDYKTIIDACAAHNVVIEINAHPRRLDLDWRWIEYAMEKGVLLSIDPDAHSINGFGDVYFGVMSAQKGGLTAASNLSSFSLAGFEAFLKESNSRRII